MRQQSGFIKNQIRVYKQKQGATNENEAFKSKMRQNKPHLLWNTKRRHCK